MSYRQPGLGPSGRAGRVPPQLRDVIAGAARNRRDALFLADARSDRRISYRSLDRRVGQWSRCLDEHGVASGCAILLDVDDPLEFAVAHLAVIASGRCSVPVDPGAPRGDLLRTVAGTRPVLMITDRERPAELGLPTLRIGAETTSDPTAERAVAFGGSVRLSTSGSTGAPKTVELDEQRLLHVARAVAAHHELGPTDRGYNALPLFHINAEVVALLGTLVVGGSLVLDRRFHRTGFWNLLRDRSITWVNAVPAVLAIAVTEPIPDLPALRFIRSASAPLSAELHRRIEDRTAVRVVESYGMTEAASQITATPLHGSVPTGSAGRPVGVRLQVRGPEGTELEPGHIGQVWIQGPGVITGYLDGRGADRFDAGHWLATGDLGHLDPDGYLTLVGRADDVINRGGEMVYPREIEEVLAGDRRVREAIVVPRPDPILGQVPVAFVLLRTDLDGRPSAEPTPESMAALRAAVADQLTRRCEQNLSRFKRPAEIEIVTELPRAATGKVLRHRLRTDALADSGTRG